MTDIAVRPLRDDLPFGARIGGVTHALLAEKAVRHRIETVFVERGLIVFEDVEPSVAMHVALSTVFGPLKDHPVATVERVDPDAAPGVIDMKSRPEDAHVVEIGGRRVAHWLPWHFDHCYNDELNRAGVLRAIDIPADGGLTGFADGIELYGAISPTLRDAIEDRRVLYTLDLRYSAMRFGLPEGFREIHEPETHRTTSALAATMPRAIHPAVWTRETGEKVLHVSPWMAVGLAGHEDADGDALLEAVCREIAAKVHPYFHRWSPTDMLVWDNWRMLHSVTGHDPAQPRRMQRTTIRGDYGLGRFEGGAAGDRLLEMTV